MSQKDETTPAGRLPNRKLWLFRGVILLVFFIVVEIASYVCLTVVNRRYPMDPLAEITPEKVEHYLTKGVEQVWQYDRDLGWSPRPNTPLDPKNPMEGPINSLGARSRHEYVDLKHTISAFGDSYTYCHGASVDDAWPTLLEESLGVGVLNFGGNGYGTDQALLRLEKQHDRIPSPTVLFCIQPENINRIVCIYKGFYERGFSPPKPWFSLEHGELQLHNPWSSPENVRDVLLDHPEKLIELARQYDYWFNNGAFLGAGAPWRIRFPYSYQLLARVPYLWSRMQIARTNIASHVPLYDPNCEPFQIMKGIVHRFRAFAAARGFKGLIVILPPPRDIYRFAEHHELVYRPLNDFLKSERIPFIDLMEDIAREPDIPATFANRQDHFSRAGSVIVAKRVAEFLDREKAIPRGGR